MATKEKWMAKAVKRPGAATRKAKAEGVGVQTWARRHAGDKGLAGMQARYARTAAKIARSRKR